MRALVDRFAQTLTDPDVTAGYDSRQAATFTLKGWRETAAGKEFVLLTAIRGEDWLVLVEERGPADKGEEARIRLERRD